MNKNKFSLRSILKKGFITLTKSHLTTGGPNQEKDLKDPPPRLENSQYTDYIFLFVKEYFKNPS